jgi:hypothetical protein
LFDFIGDVHGRADQLHALLDQLGYTKKEGTYGHPKSTAVFVGDLINKGPQSREVLQTVKAMVDAGHARMVLGNHELNLIGLFYRHKKNDFIQAHSDKNRKQQEPILSSFAGEEDTLLEYVQWLRKLPLFLETEAFRVAHAYWHQPSIDFIQRYHPQRCPDDQMLYEMTPGSRVENAVKEIAEGVRLPEPRGDATFKAKWWNLGKSNEYTALAIRPDAHLGNPKVSIGDISVQEYQYPEDAKPFFFGHYNLPGQPILLAHNYACLDFNEEDKPLVVAYRWEAEQILESRKICWY